MVTQSFSGSAVRFFTQVVRFPKIVVLVSLLLMAGLLWFLPQLSKDTRADAFLAADNPALLYRDKVKAQFGLSDPIVIAVVREGQGGIFNPQTLALVEQLSFAVSELPNIDAERVISLATENNIVGTDEGMDVDPFFDPVPVTQEQADAVRRAIDNFPLYQGSLVATDGHATLIVAEMVDEDLAEKTYDEILALVDEIATNNGEELHVAGEGAIAGYLGSYIDADAQRLNPLAGLVITLIILLAFRRLAPALLGNVIIAASVLMTLSIMAASGVAFFVITNALPVILIGISVADAIHIFSHYYDLQARQPNKDKEALVVDTMVEMWRPVTLTTLTTVAGFMGLYFAAYMPPFSYFGLFTAIGVLVAWFYSLLFLPAAMAIVKPQVSAGFVRAWQQQKPDVFSSFMGRIGKFTQQHAKATLLLGLLLALSGVYSASQLTVDEDRIETFHVSEAIYQADEVINRHLDGSNNLDIVVETAMAEDLFEPANLSKIEALQTYAESLPHVMGSTSIVDYLKQMNRSLNEGRADAYHLPKSKELAAQYFLLYSASSEPTDFEEEVDYDYQTANIRVNLNSGSYVNTKIVVEALQDYLSTEFNSTTITATLSGRVNVNYHWIRDLGSSHFAGLGIALSLVWMVSSLLFRSTLAGLFSLIPVAGAVLLVYAAMVLLGIHLGIGTSMFASVAIGLGVDFAIHTIERLRVLYREYEGDLGRAMDELYLTTGRALLFNYLAIAGGFGVLISSKVVPLNNFGLIVVMSVTTSFVASMTLLPALVKVFKPRFMEPVAASGPTGLRRAIATVAMVLIIGITGLWGVSSAVKANELPTGDWIVEQINNIDDGEYVSRKLTMQMIDRRGKQRLRETISYRKYFGDEKRTILFYLAPANVKDTAFLTYDYKAPSTDDDQWLYLPALRKVRRISASDRGDYFLGTDFTYEDIKKEGKIEPGDFNFTTLGQEILDASEVFLVEATPQSDAIARELGYGKTRFWVNSSNWIIVKAKYWDTKGKLLKTLVAGDIRQIDGIWTRHGLTINNHKTGHQTIFTFSEVDYRVAVRGDVFTKRALSKGR